MNRLCAAAVALKAAAVDLLQKAAHAIADIARRLRDWITAAWWRHAGRLADDPTYRAVLIAAGAAILATVLPDRGLAQALLRLAADLAQPPRGRGGWDGGWDDGWAA